MESCVADRLLAPDSPLLLRLAGRLQEEGQYPLAVERFRRALNGRSTDDRALHSLGVMALDLGMMDTAVELLQNAVAAAPAAAEYHKDLGLACRAAGRIEAALRHFLRAITLDARCADAYFHLGATLAKPQCLDEACLCFQRAVALRPDRSEFHFNLGRALQDSGKLNDAARCYEEALRLDPRFRPALLNLALVLKDLDQLDRAAELCHRALAAKPGDPVAHNNLGLTLKAQGELDKAMACFKSALESSPQYADALLNLAVTHRELGQYLPAFAQVREAIRCQPLNPEAHWNLSFLLLLSGYLAEGWKEYEWRWKTREYQQKLRDFAQPQWNGKALQGRTILVHAEQGMGDTLQFVRYAPMIAGLGGRVLLECQPSLKRLLQGMPRIDGVFARGENLPAFDLHTPLLNLPRLLGTELDSIPSQTPYLKPPLASRLAQEFPESGSPKIGLAWAGNPNHLNDRQRSFPLQLLAPLLQMPQPAFYSLQVGPQAAELKTVPHAGRITDLAPGLADFADTAAAIDQLDLVISADTSVAHLAGALGKPVWLLLPFAPDWRWMLNRDDSPWYPTMRIFRQRIPGDWASVISRAAAELARFP